MTRRSWALLLLVLQGCSCRAPVETPIDAAIDASASDAVPLDAAPDAAVSARCATPAPWSLASARWSTDFAPRGVVGGWGYDSYVVLGLAVHDEDVFLAGYFDRVGAIAAHNVAVWSEAEGFRALGDGIDDDYAAPVVVRPDGSVVVASRRFDGTSRTLRVFEGGAWRAIGAIEGNLSQLALDVDGSVIAAGDFTMLAGIPTNGLARWDGTSVTVIDAPRGSVSAVLADASGLCVGGHDAAGPYAACRDAGGSWSDQGLFAVDVLDLERDATGALLVGGYIGTEPGVTTGVVLRQEGTRWTFVGERFTSSDSQARVSALLHEADGTLVAVGHFEELVGGRPVLAYAARWNGTRWDPLAAPVPLSSAPRPAIVRGNDLFVAGDFVEAYGPENVSAFGIVRWDGTRWHALGPPTGVALGNARVVRLAVGADCATFVAGGMLAAGDVSSSHVAVLGADAWSALPPLEAAPSVLAAAPDGTLYAGGFGQGELVRPSSDLMRLRGDSWEPVDVPDGVTALAFARDGTTYVGVSGQVLVLDGAGATPLGEIEPHGTRAMLVSDEGLLVADATQVRRWDGASWTVVATLSFLPSDMIAWNGHVVIGGQFGLAFLADGHVDPVTYPRIESADIVALAGVGRQLIAVGRRSGVAGTFVAAAAWSDEHGTWHELAFDRPVTDVAVVDGALLFAGDFTNVDGVPSMGIARLEAP